MDDRLNDVLDEARVLQLESDILHFFDECHTAVVMKSVNNSDEVSLAGSVWTVCSVVLVESSLEGGSDFELVVDETDVFVFKTDEVDTCEDSLQLMVAHC